jgi:hypothetical protein
MRTVSLYKGGARCAFDHAQPSTDVDAVLGRGVFVIFSAAVVQFLCTNLIV